MAHPLCVHDERILDRLARARYGSTAFLCPHCGHTGARLVKRRPRDRVCLGCRRWTSITSGTLLHGTRLPLVCWEQRALELEHSPDIPTTTESSETFGIARSSAWHLNQRLFRLCGAARASGTATLLHPVTLRRPKPSPPLPESAPAHVRALHADHRDGRVRRATATAALLLVDHTARLIEIAPAEQRHQEHPDPSNPTSIDDRTRLRSFLHRALVLVHRTVSLRWLPRWLDALLVGWNLPSEHAPPWPMAALQCEPRPLRALDPWRAATQRSQQPPRDRRNSPGASP